MNEVFMDTDRVEQLAQRFNNLAKILQAVAKVLELQMNILRTTAFIGLVGGYAVKRYLAIIKPKILDTADFLEEISRDLKVAVQNHINGDKEGASRFY